MKLGRHCNYHKGRGAIRHYANLREPLENPRFKLYYLVPTIGDQVLAEIHTHNHYYLVQQQDGTLQELPGLSNTSPAMVQVQY